MCRNNSKMFVVITLAACLSLAAIAHAAPGLFEDSPATQPSSPGIIAASDKAALEANFDKDVTVEGVVSEAEWSGTGKVMIVRFEGAKESKFTAVVFLKNKTKIDEAFGGDAGKLWTGAKVRLHGKLRQYNGKGKASTGTPEMTISNAAQVTVIEPAPTTQPVK